MNDEPWVGLYPADFAFVLPRDYGFGFRFPTDRIWGIWEADDLSQQIWDDVHTVLETHVLSLDIVYETIIAGVSIELPYSWLLFWNGMTLHKT